MLPQNLGHRIGANSVNDLGSWLAMVGNESVLTIGSHYTGCQVGLLVLHDL